MAAPETTDDRTAKARIRDAAIGVYAEHGVEGTTARRVAAAAEVSPGLVIHHFGSMDGLRAACDEHVAALIREQKQQAMATGPGLDVMGALREAQARSMTDVSGYLARVLAHDSPSVAALVDELVRDAEGYLAQGVASGIVTPTDDPHGRAVLLTIWSLGTLVLHRHLARLLGVDPTEPDFGTDPAAAAAYVRPAMDLLSTGVLTEAFAEQTRQTLADPARTTEGARP